MTKIEKRYQLFGRNGVEWTPWFPTTNEGKELWQLKSSNLKNEYREVDDTGNITPIKISYRASKKTETKKK